MVAPDYDTIMGVMQRRRSVRRYGRETINDALLDKLLKAAQLAPSAGNLQARDFILVRDPNRKHELAEAAYRPVLYHDGPDRARWLRQYCALANSVWTTC